ncbi:Poly-specific ribonuclease PARN [Golovinomyces cichoracearum]|uniref:Poly-specific ribonuclease PARN n=1 Tax=Golovinomyces cichoracearum TaxID=62708 RepID=A0A420J9N7_9PEZI|nr:Poly-specific ribonuclease PARN [Golovinomyces cichoracearum]
MEICQTLFYKRLFDILKNISNASFVTIDLEMSGIPTRSRFSPGSRSQNATKPTLQQQYDDVRSAAETFQILQVGLTLVEEVREKDFYIARPYNFDLSPLSYRGNDIGLQRTFSFSSSACDFLQKNSFDIGKVFRTGVPYLSREEESRLRKEDDQRAENKSKIPDLIIKNDDTNALKFCQDVRSSITDWLKKARPDLLKDCKLTGFQRRLVYQIVRKEFPDLRAFGRSDGDFMQIEKLDLKNEANFQTERLRRFNSKIIRQIGFRWVFEALCGGDVSEIDPLWFYDMEDDESEKQPNAIASRIKELNAKLLMKDHIIVGHNLFMDLAFLYKTFVGPLPSYVEEFKNEIHRLFPKIIDTKFMATHGLETMFTRSSLKEVLKPLQVINNPLILLHQDHREYGSSFGKDHEAGYDSWMTAELFIKLSAKIHSEQNELKDIEENTGFSHDENKSSQEISDNHYHKEEDSSTAPISSDQSFQKDVYPTKNFNSSFVSTNPFAVLENIDPEQSPEDTSKLNITARCDHRWLPDFTDDFWLAYFNKIRVNSIEGGTCDMATSDSDDGDTSDTARPDSNEGEHSPAKKKLCIKNK